MQFDEQQVKDLSMLPIVEQSFTLGSVLSVTIHTDDKGEDNESSSQSNTNRVIQLLKERGILARPIGNV
eukprot:CAMPEP_0172463662 /NCGR_PEP_ID=MMETSP1065-20121228/48013_1 /TAXON_ID=265537 /ORGANISM="Amphiprora paludosa, Strain CCMP125" /LENGTH=68 /DNA_ID=CAMNT_0013219669 /DNA_START=39 /DNA_END=242 /DNA_ORIENTATION=-